MSGDQALRAMALLKNLILDPLAYPIRGGGKYVLVTAAVISLMADVASLAPLLGFFAWWLLFGYLCGVYFQIIQTTAVGEEEAPAYPETSSVMDDIIVPALQVVAVLLASFVPFLLYIFLFAGETAEPLPLYGTLAFALLYAPMAILAVTVLGYLGAMSPHIVLPAIVRSGGLYVPVVLVLAALYYAEAVIGGWLRDWWIVRHLVMAVMGIYVMMANGRMLGLLYRERQDELGWL